MHTSVIGHIGQPTCETVSTNVDYQFLGSSLVGYTIYLSLDSRRLPPANVVQLITLGLATESY